MYKEKVGSYGVMMIAVLNGRTSQVQIRNKPFKFEGIRRRITKIITRVEDYSHWEILEKLGLSTKEETEVV